MRVLNRALLLVILACAAACRSTVTGSPELPADCPQWGALAADLFARVAASVDRPAPRIPILGDLRVIELWYLPQGHPEASVDGCEEGGAPLSSEDIGALREDCEQRPSDQSSCLPEGSCVGVATPIPDWLLPHLTLNQIALTPQDRSALAALEERQRQYLDRASAEEAEPTSRRRASTPGRRGIDRAYLAGLLHNNTAFGITHRVDATGPTTLGLDAYPRVGPTNKPLAVLTLTAPPGGVVDVQGEVYREALERDIDPLLLVPGRQRFPQWKLADEGTVLLVCSDLRPMTLPALADAAAAWSGSDVRRALASLLCRGDEACAGETLRTLLP